MSHAIDDHARFSSHTAAGRPAAMALPCVEMARTTSAFVSALSSPGGQPAGDRRPSSRLPLDQGSRHALPAHGEAVPAPPPTPGAAELRRSNDALQHFAMTASHDLQEPLRMISSYAGLLSRRWRGKMDEDSEFYLDTIIDASVRMQRMVKNLLTYARAGHTGGSFAPVDCEQVVRSAVANLRAVIEESGAAVSFDPLPTVVGDPSRLCQLFQNLISNAIKYRSQAAPTIAIGAEPADAGWLFRVEDNGVGVPPDERERIFELFERSRHQRHSDGDGIGLAICRGIVEAHGGRIWVEPAANGGSVFHLTIMSSTQDSPAVAASAPAVG
jgi:light-regulated signal transduction histidine kinase (bacteriophytochrome)